jgi:hypothetical protein
MFIGLNLSQWADVVTIAGVVTLFGGLITFSYNRVNSSIIEYKRIRHLLLLLRSQLSVIGFWAGAEKGGYRLDQLDDLIKENEKSWGNPFSQVFLLENINLPSVTLFPELLDLNESLAERLVGLNREVETFNNVLEEISKFKWSRSSDKNIILHLRLNNKNIEPEDVDEEEFFKRKLVESYALLHVTHIGDKLREDNRRLHYKHWEADEALKKAITTFKSNNKKFYRWLIPFWRNEYTKSFTEFI